MTVLTAIGRQAFRVGAVRAAALSAGAARGFGLALVFHRIADGAEKGPRLLPSVSQSLFRQQVEMLLEIGEVVPLDRFLAPPADRQRPRFALTFDDDLPSHCERALPVLRELGVTATFFLSGRALNGLGPLWFEKLDGLIASEGVGAAARLVGVDTNSVERLAIACEDDPRIQERIDELPNRDVRNLSGSETRELVGAGMTIGFHTLGHRPLPLLPEQSLDEALTRGRTELERAVGQPLRLFAYPHGKADDRAAKRVADAGFTAACTGRPLAFRFGDNPYRIGRWEPGAIPLERFAAVAAAKLSGLGRRG